MNKTMLNNIFKEKKLDVIISTSYQTRLWYAKVITSDGYIFIEKDRADLLVDSRYIEYARKNAKNADVHLIKKDSVKDMLTTNKEYKKVGIEEDYMTLKDFENFKKILPNAEFISISGQELRIIKSKEEVELIREGGKISLKALEEIKHLIKPGTKEKTIDHQLNLKLKELGGDKESFDSIVVSGANGALPHGKPSNKELKDGELVTIDFGVYYKGYATDVTRTFKVGEVQDDKLNEIFDIVKEAQKLGIEAVKPGIMSSEIDKICRDYIKEKGYGKEFVHSTGHGLGIDIHELPVVTNSQKFDRKLEEGMVITVEPGIYIEGFGGVRFEDDILVTKNGYEVLSKR